MSHETDQKSLIFKQINIVFNILFCINYYLHVIHNYYFDFEARKNGSCNTL